MASDGTNCDNEYDLTFQQREGYLHAHVKCERITARIATRYLRRIADQCDQLGEKNVLLVRDIPAVLDHDAMFQSKAFFLLLMRGRRVAWVNPFPAIIEEMRMLVDIGAEY